MSTAASLAQAVVDVINGETWPLAFTAEKAVAPTLKLEELRDLTVQVAAGPSKYATVDRGDLQQTTVLQVGVLQRVKIDDLDTIDALSDLTEAIGELLGTRNLTSPAASVIDAGALPNADPGGLRRRGLFIGVVQPTYLLL